MTQAATNRLFFGFCVPFSLAFLACAGRPAEAPLPAGQPAAPPAASMVAQAAAASAVAPAASSTPAPPARVPPAVATPEPASSGAAAPALASTMLTADASTIQKLFDSANHAASATLKAKGVAGNDAVARGLRDVARKAARGMEPDGPLATGTLNEKEILQTDVTLQPGKCYAIVGFSRQVKDLDLYLLLAPGILSGQDTTDDNSPVIGGEPQPMCPVAPMPVRYKLGIVADQGFGDVAAQLFSKSR